MGSFSWCRSEMTTKRSNLTWGDHYKVLVPEKFGGGSIPAVYTDYGELENPYGGGRADLYGILAWWNGCEDMIYDGDRRPRTMEEILRFGRTMSQANRDKGIDIGCYSWDVYKLLFPLKLVSASYKGTYEECPGRSYSDPDQGFCKGYWGRGQYLVIEELLHMEQEGEEIVWPDTPEKRYSFYRQLEEMARKRWYKGRRLL